MLAAVAYVLALTVHIHMNFIPGAEFLAYDPMDAVIATAGFIYGPIYSVILSFVVSTLKLLTHSHSGPIGALMQIIATVAYCLPATIIYKHNKSRKAAAIGLALSVVSMLVIMLPANYFIGPLYLNVSSEVMLSMLPVLAAFNAVKACVNSVLTFIVYKPIVKVLRQTHLLEER